MFSKIQSIIWNYFFPQEDNLFTQAGKRPREDNDDSASGELTKRLCSMAESRMPARRTTPTTNVSRSLAPLDPAVDTDIKPLSLTSHQSSCTPRRPSGTSGRSRTKLKTLPCMVHSQHAPLLVERNIPILVERNTQDDVTAGLLYCRRSAKKGFSGQLTSGASGTNGKEPKDIPKAAHSAHNFSTSSGKGARSSGAQGAGSAAGSDEDVVVIGEVKHPVRITQKGSESDFVDLRSLRQVLDKGRVAGRTSSYRRSQHKPYTDNPHRSMVEKLKGMAPSPQSVSRRGLSTYSCFRLDEKQRYQALLSEMSSSSLPASSLGVSAALRTGALRKEPLQLAAGADLKQRISLVDLASGSSESSHSQSEPQSQSQAVDRQLSRRTHSRRSSSSSDDVIIECVVPPPPLRPATKLERDMTRQMRHLSELRQRYALAERDRQLRIREKEGRRDVSGADDAQWQCGLTQRIRGQTRMALEAEPLVISSGEEEEHEEQVLPEITPEMEAKISAALRPSPPTEPLAEAFNLRITRHDLQTLKGLNWLNDEVINFYMNLLMERNKNSYILPKLYCFNTFFYGKIVSQGHHSVRRWTKKVDIFLYDLLMIPVHLGMHWCLACVDLRDQIVRYFDSMSGYNERGLEAILRYLRAEHLDKKKTPLDISQWQAVHEQDIPQQMNGSDCGMFTCKFADYLARDAPVTFSQEHMPYFRRRMVYEIITKQLLQ